MDYKLLLCFTCIWTLFNSDLVLTSAAGLSNDDYSVEVNYEQKRNGDGELNFSISSRKLSVSS